MSRRAPTGTHLLAIVTAVVFVSMILLAAVPSSAQTSTEFPVPVLAPVRDEGVDPQLAITAIHRDPSLPAGEDGASALIVRTGTPVGELPDGARVSIVGGAIDGAQQRVSLIVEAGAATGEVAESTPDGFEPSGTADVAITPEGFARFPFTAADPTALVWAEIELPDGRTSRTPAFPLAQLIDDPGTGALTAATAATVYDDANLPTGEVLALDAVPTLEVVNQAVIVRTTQPPPSQFAGVGVTKVQDFLRIAPDFSTGGQAPYFIVIDYTERTITFFDGSDGLPVEVALPESLWLTEGLTEDEIETSSVTFDRAGLSEAVGQPTDAPIALGVSRRLTLEDGRTASAEGVLATLPWFDAGAAEGLPTATTTPGGSVPESVVETTVAAPTATIDPNEGDSDTGPNGQVVIVAAILAAVLAGAAVWTARRNRRQLADPDLGLGAMAKVVDKASVQEGEKRPASDLRQRARTGVKVPAEKPKPDATPAVSDALVVDDGAVPATATDEPQSDDGEGDKPPVDETVDGETAKDAATPAATALDAPPVTDSSDPGSAVGVAGTRAALAREAEARAAAERGLFGSDDPTTSPSEDTDEVGRDALWAAMRRKAAEVGLEPPDESDAEDADARPPADDAPADETPRDTAERTVRPDDALDALNQLIDDLRLPGDE